MIYYKVTLKVSIFIRLIQINTDKAFIDTPVNGAVYVEQPAIIEGDVDGQVTVASNAKIIIGNNITYEQDGNDVLGMMARTDVIMALWSPNSLSIRGAIIAQEGRRRSFTGTEMKSGTFNHKGATATNLSPYMSMFNTRLYEYDPTLLYLQPPYFPILEESYTVLDFRELIQ